MPGVTEYQEVRERGVTDPASVPFSERIIIYLHTSLVKFTTKYFQQTCPPILSLGNKERNAILVLGSKVLLAS